MSHEDLEGALRGLFRDVDRVSSAAREAANAAFGWRSVNAELARLTADSGRELAHLRGGPPRLLTFAVDRLLIELEVSPGDGPALIGQLDPPQAAEVTVEAAAGPRTTRADEHGRFLVPDLAGSWTRVVVTPADQGTGPVVTEWFLA
jgi:hypothetical protein